MSPVDRTQVLWGGPDSPDQAEFVKRNLTLSASNSFPTESEFAVSCAIILRFDNCKPKPTTKAIAKFLERAGDHGLLIFLDADSERQIKRIQYDFYRLKFKLPVDFSDPQFPRPKIMLTVRKQTHEIAELAARHHAGMAFQAQVEIKGGIGNKKDRFLLRRAFSDCKSITVESLRSGRSGARVLAVYAEFPADLAGPNPLPYFVKIDERSRIVQEYEAYSEFVSRHIPFAHRPNLELKRCMLGWSTGLLVGDFVEDSVPFSAVVKQAGAMSVIHSLFDDALRGWRQRAFDPTIIRIPFSEFRKDIFEPDRLRNLNLKAARKFGAKRDPHDLRMLIERLAEHDYRRGTMHGDLNVENIRVRNGQAVLIDFYKTRQGPLAADLAALEIAICFTLEADREWDRKAFGAYSESKQFRDWQKNIDLLFDFRQSRSEIVALPEEQPCSLAWMWSACRQLRLMAHYLQPEANAYVLLLVSHMLRVTMYSDTSIKLASKAPSTFVRGYAYFTAERILNGLPASKTS